MKPEAKELSVCERKGLGLPGAKRVADDGKRFSDDGRCGNPFFLFCRKDERGTESEVGRVRKLDQTGPW